MRWPPVNEPHEVDGEQRGENLGTLFETIRGEGVSQPQSIGGEIIRSRDRAAHGTTREKICRTAGRLAEGGIKSPSITKLYLVGTTDRWNDAKKSEEHDRVKHNIFE